MLVLAGGTLLGAIALFWASLRSIVDDDGETREVAEVDPLDARHTMLLRQLKDLDAEHALGRTEDADYKDMVARVRAELKAVLRQQDARIAPFETDAEALLARARASKKPRRAVAAASDAAAATEPTESSATDDATSDEGEGEDVATSGAGPASERESASDAASDAKAERACPSCKTPNDTDAVFCKKCGTRLGEPEALARAEAGDAREEDA